MNHYKSWSGLNKQLSDCLCDALKNRVSYFLARYHQVHNSYGRASIRLDGKELAVFTWFDGYKQENDIHKRWQETGIWDVEAQELKQKWEEEGMADDMGMTAEQFGKRKWKHDSQYISYMNRGDSAAVLIVRDIVKSINTHHKWIDVLETKGTLNYDNRWDFSEISVELFPRMVLPQYPQSAPLDEKKYITWKTAVEDIEEQRMSGYTGTKFRIILKLVNENAGKTITVQKCWNKTFERYVPMRWKTSSCEIRNIKKNVRPKWNYHILSINQY